MRHPLQPQKKICQTGGPGIRTGLLLLTLMATFQENAAFTEMGKCGKLEIFLDLCDCLSQKDETYIQLEKVNTRRF